LAARTVSTCFLRVPFLTLGAVLLLFISFLLPFYYLFFAP
jgi:hypothetical protein